MTHEFDAKYTLCPAIATSLEQQFQIPTLLPHKSSIVSMEVHGALFSQQQAIYGRVSV